MTPAPQSPGTSGENPDVFEREITKLIAVACPDLSIIQHRNLCERIETIAIETYGNQIRQHQRSGEKEHRIRENAIEQFVCPYPIEDGETFCKSNGRCIIDHLDKKARTGHIAGEFCHAMQEMRRIRSRPIPQAPDIDTLNFAMGLAECLGTGHAGDFEECLLCPLEKKCKIFGELQDPEHDAAIRKDEREKVLKKVERIIKENTRMNSDGIRTLYVIHIEQEIDSLRQNK